MGPGGNCCSLPPCRGVEGDRAPWLQNPLNGADPKLAGENRAKIESKLENLSGKQSFVMWDPTEGLALYVRGHRRSQTGTPTAVRGSEALC